MPRSPGPSGPSKRLTLVFALPKASVSFTPHQDEHQAIDLDLRLYRKLR